MDLENQMAIYEEGQFYHGFLSGQYINKQKGTENKLSLLELMKLQEEQELISYIGAFDNAGNIQLEQPEELEQDTMLYAINDTLNAYLYIMNNHGKMDWKSLGLYSIPTHYEYAYKEDKSDEIVRIVNANITVFDGTNWVVLGNINDLLQQDYIPKWSEAMKNELIVEEVDFLVRGSRMIIEKPVVTSSPKKTAAPKSTPVPETVITQTPTPVQTAAPAPAQTDRKRVV